MEETIYTENASEGRKAPIWKIAIITGVVGAIPGIILFLLTQPKDFSVEQKSSFILQILPYLLQLAAITWGVVWLKKQWPEPEFTFGSGFKAGVRTGLFYGLTAGIGAYINMVILRQDPEKLEKMRAMAVQAAEKRNPNISDEEIQTILKVTDFMSMPIISFLGVVFFTMIIALLLSLVVSVFTQTRPTS